MLAELYENLQFNRNVLTRRSVRSSVRHTWSFFSTKLNKERGIKKWKTKDLKYHFGYKFNYVATLSCILKYEPWLKKLLISKNLKLIFKFYDYHNFTMKILVSKFEYDPSNRQLDARTPFLSVITFKKIVINLTL